MPFASKFFLQAGCRNLKGWVLLIDMEDDEKTHGMTRPKRPKRCYVGEIHIIALAMQHTTAMPLSCFLASAVVHVWIRSKNWSSANLGSDASGEDTICVPLIPLMHSRVYLNSSWAESTWLFTQNFNISHFKIVFPRFPNLVCLKKKNNQIY